MNSAVEDIIKKITKFRGEKREEENKKKII